MKRWGQRLTRSWAVATLLSGSSNFAGYSSSKCGRLTCRPEDLASSSRDLPSSDVLPFTVDCDFVSASLLTVEHSASRVLAFSTSPFSCLACSNIAGPSCTTWNLISDFEIMRISLWDEYHIPVWEDYRTSVTVRETRTNTAVSSPKKDDTWSSELLPSDWTLYKASSMYAPQHNVIMVMADKMFFSVSEQIWYRLLECIDNITSEMELCQW